MLDPDGRVTEPRPGATNPGPRAAEGEPVMAKKKLNIPDEARLKGAANGNAANVAKAEAFYLDVYPRIRELRQQGLSYHDVAAALNAEGHKTRRGGPYSGPQVYNLCNRYEGQ